MPSVSRPWSAFGRSLTMLAMLASAVLLRCGGQSESTGSAGSGGNEGGTGGSGPGGTSSGTAGVSAGTGGTDPGFCVYDPEAPYSVTVPLDVYCDYFECSASLDEAIAEAQGFCSDGFIGETLRQGCGFSWLGFDGGLGGGREVFDESGALVGASNFNDILYGPCNAAAYRAGVSAPDCDETVSCMMCLPYNGAPVCRFDCDCKNMEPVIDPCFGPDSCQCYCAELESTIGR